MMVKSGLEKTFLNSLHVQSLFRKIFLLHRKVDFCQNCKFSNKYYHFCAQRNFKQKNCDACSYNKWNLKPQISPIFHFEYVNPVWISGVVGVKKHTILGTHNFVLRTYKISLLKNIQMEFLILVHCEQYVLGLHSGTPSYLAKFFYCLTSNIYYLSYILKRKS